MSMLQQSGLDPAATELQSNGSSGSVKLSPFWPLSPAFG
jgi:hypothetical protein